MDDLAFYRPVSPISCVAKLFDRLVQARLVWTLEKRRLLPDAMIGFCSRLSATVNLLGFVSALVQAKQEEKSSTAAV